MQSSIFLRTLFSGKFNLVKALTPDRIQSRKEQAVRFTRDVLNDPDRADEIEAESLEDYAERRKFTITNPNKRSTRNMADGKTKAELEAQIEDLEAENQDLQDQLDAIADIVGGDDQHEDDESGDDDSGDADEDDTDDDDGDDLPD